jgi:hypothetical protein
MRTGEVAKEMTFLLLQWTSLLPQQLTFLLPQQSNFLLLLIHQTNNLTVEREDRNVNY